MSKRKISSEFEDEPMTKKIQLDLNLTKENSSGNDIEIPDLSRVNIDEIENTIFEAVKRNNFSSAKAKYLIKQMLKHPNVVEWFRNIFSSDNQEFNLSFEPRVTRAARRRDGDEPGTSSELSANLIGRLLLSAPTITSVDFDLDDCADRDYSPDTDQSESDESSTLTECQVNESEDAPLSPYVTRSKKTIDDLQADLLDDSVELIEEEIHVDENPHIYDYNLSGDLSLEEMYGLMDVDVDGELYDQFKKSLNIDSPMNYNIDDDPEFDVFAQIDDLDEDIFDDCRDDRSVKIPKSELWALLKDNNLVNGSENSSCNKKTITMLCENEDIIKSEPSDDIMKLIGTNFMKFNVKERERLQRQTSMFYQILATNFIMLYDQPHLCRLNTAQIDLYFKMSNNIPEDSDCSIFDPPNRLIVESILHNYKGLNYLPTVRFNKNVSYKKVEFPKCVIATLLCSPAFPYRELLPTSFKIYNDSNVTFLRPTPFLATEDKLLTLGIIHFSHQSHKMLKLIHKYLFPIRSTEQLRYRKTNILRRFKELNSSESGLIVDLLQFSTWYNQDKSTALKVCSNLSKTSLICSSIWQRPEEWHCLPEVFIRFLKKTVPDTMMSLDLCGKEGSFRAKRAVTVGKTQSEKQMQYCNWSALPWQTEKVNFVKSQNKKPYLKTILRKIVKEKSYPQYEIPQNSNFRNLLHKWNCYSDYRKSCTKKIRASNQCHVTMTCNHARKLVSKSHKILRKAKFKRAKLTNLITQQSYAHYFRDESTEKLFPATIFRRRLEELMLNKSQKSLRISRFHDKCKLREGDIVDTFAPFSSNKDENDLKFCRNLLNDMQCQLDADHYEQCLRRINNFYLDESDTDCNALVMDLMKDLMDTVNSEPSNADLYEDLVSLLTPHQALQMGLEIKYNKIKNSNQLYMMIKSTRHGSNRRFWIRLSALLNKVNQGDCSMSKVIQYLTNNLKHNPYLQSLIAPLLNCWEAPFPNFPETFANFDFLSSNACWSDLTEGQESDKWEYCTALSDSPKSVCGCNCHRNATNKEGAVTRHCSKCSLKAAGGSIYLDEGKFHKRLVRIKWPSEVVPGQMDVARNQKTETADSVSVLEHLRSRCSKPSHLHNRCISIKNVPVLCRDQPQSDVIKDVSPCLNYMQIIKEDDAAMDADLFRQIKGQPMPVDADSPVDVKIPNFDSTVKQEKQAEQTNWNDTDKMLLLTECQKNGPSPTTFSYLHEVYFKERSLTEIEAQFNALFQQLLEYHQHNITNAL